jgi:TM2 domain-containing membrane protein YozV
MHCVNHPGTEVQSYCQHCGKPLCESCVRKTASGQILCEECLTATGGDPARSPWQGAVPNQAPPFYPMPSRGPNPSAAAVLGLIPGVGAMYNGQLFKGLIHVVVFAVLVSITDRYTIFLIFVFAWCEYQSFEAFHTAKARRDGLPIPDPFGLNELGSWINLGGQGRSSGTNYGSASPGAPPSSTPPGNFPSGSATEPPPYSAPYTSSWTAGTAAGSGPVSGPPGGFGAPQPPYTEPYASQAPYGDPYAPGSYAPGTYPPGSYPPGTYPPGSYPAGTDPTGFVPPATSIPPYGWRRKEPVFAFVLIGLGIVFLLQSMGIVGHILHYIWPVMLIGMGIWLILRRMGDARGGSK